MFRHFISLVALSACNATGPKPEPAVETTDTSTTTSLPSEYAPTLEDSVTHVYDESDATAALQSVVEALTALQGDPIFVAYDEAMEAAEGGCPAWYEQDGYVFWYASCTTTSGVWFDGYAFTAAVEGYTVDEEGNVWDTRYVSGAGTVRAASGATFHIGGYVQQSWTERDDGWQIVSEAFQGSFQADEAPPDSWLATDIQPSIGQYRAWNPTLGGTGAAYAVIAGAIGGTNAQGAYAADVDQLLLASTNIGYPCAEEPAGTMDLRTPEGVWWTVRFDVDPEDWSTEGACDGCGTVYDGDDIEVGQVCGDFSPLLGL